VLLTAALFLAATVAIAVGARSTYEEHVRQLEAETRTMAATVVVYVDQNLATADGVATTAARHPQVRRLDPAAAAEVLQPLLSGRQRLVHNVLLADTTGTVVVWATPPVAAVEGTLDPAWLKRVASSGQPGVSPMLGGPGDPAHAIVLAYPITAVDGSLVGLLGISIHLEELEQILASIPLPPGSVVTLTDANSIVVARSLDARRYVGRPTVAPGESPLQPSQVPTTRTLTGIDGIERVFGNAVIERGPWLASVGIPVSVAMQRTMPIYYRNFGISITVSTFVIGLSMWIARRWVVAFDHLDSATRRVARSDLSPLDLRHMPTAELEHMQHTISGMITSLRNARESIASQVDEGRRMRQEVQSLQQQIIRQERLAAIGVLVSGVAHELNNPLQAILGFAELLQMQPGMPEQARADLTLIQKESARASAIIRNLSRFGRQMSEPTPVRLRDVVVSMLELRQRKLEELNIAVDVEEKSNAVVMAIFTELQQVLLNFAINAEQAVVASATATRKIVIRSGDEAGWAWIELEDSGPGVPAEHEAKLFQPFYTTKPVGEGTGLGLSVSYDIVRSHGGRIGYRRSPSGGAIFFFELPVVEDVIEKPKP
jgi:signal transduction histidine kinase